MQNHFAKIFAIPLLALSLNLTGCGREVVLNGNFSHSRLGHVVGGQPEKINEFPFVVSIGQACTGTLIDPEWVLSAAHCNGENYVLVWDQNLNPVNQGKGEQVKKIKIAESFVHPDFEFNDLSAINDVLLLKLSEPVASPYGIGPAPMVRLAMPHEQNHYQVGKMARVVGLGYTCESCELPASTPFYKDLNGIDLPIVSRADANRPESYNGVVGPGMIAAGYKTGGKDSCQGDSGGPLIAETAKGKWVQIGITSWGDGCGRPNKYGIYADVSHYYHWITKTMSDNQSN